MKEGLNIAMMVFGEHFVMMVGQSWMLQWLAGSLDTLLKVSSVLLTSPQYSCVYTNVTIPYQVHWPFLVLHLDGEVVKYTWLMWNAVEQRCHWENAQVVMQVAVAIGKMQGSDAVVRCFIHFHLY